MLTCQFCGLIGTKESGDFQIDKGDMGFWCESRDAYTYLNKSQLNIFLR